MGQYLRAGIVTVGVVLSNLPGGIVPASGLPLFVTEMIQVSLFGQVVKPGTKHLPAGSTLDQVFAVSGGLPGSSDLDPDDGWPPVVCKVSRIGDDGEKLTFRVRINVDPHTRVITTVGQPFTIRQGDLIVISPRELLSP